MTAAAASIAPVEPISVDLGRGNCPADWDQYVMSHAEGEVFHRSGWMRAINAVYGYDAYYIGARRGDALVGILPLVDVRSPLLGRSLISTAFSVGGGPLFDDGDVLAALLDAAAGLATSLGVQYTECRSNFADAHGWLAKSDLYAGFELPIPADEDANLKAIPRKRRAEVRKGLSLLEKGESTISDDNDVDVFYDLYARSVHGLGTPIFPKTFVSALAANLSAETEILTIRHHGEPVVALLSFYFKNKVMPYYVGALPAARAVRGFDLAYWAVMRRAADRGIGVFDFGRSKIGSGPYDYKKLWGAEPQPLTYRVKLERASEMPNINPNNSKFAMFAKLWPRLPLPVANRLGPLLARNLP